MRARSSARPLVPAPPSATAPPTGSCTAAIYRPPSSSGCGRAPMAPGWSEPGGSADLLARFSGGAAEPRALMAIPDSWAKWALFERPALRAWTAGPVTLLGDAAHPILPFLAQGGAMAIEDAAVLADCLAHSPHPPALPFASFPRPPRSRTLRVARESRNNGWVYHLSGPAALARNIALKRLSGEKLLTRYDWLYDWRPD